MATPVLDLSRNSETNRSIILSKVHSPLETAETIAQLKDNYLQEMADKIVRIENRAENTYIIVCDSWKSCKEVANKYKEKEFNEQVPSFEMFSDTDPGVQTGGRPN